MNKISTCDYDGSAFVPQAAGATTSEDSLPLAEALVVAGAQTGYFIVDPSGKVNSEGQPECGMAPPVFSFATP